MTINEEIISNGNLNILTNNYTSIGAITQAKNENINVANDINIKSQEVRGEQMAMEKLKAS